MPTATFDVTEKCVAFMKETIKNMPGNPGQEVLVADLDYSGCQFLVNVVYDFEGLVDIDSEYRINLRSNHPEAIEIIMETAEQAGEEIGEASAELGPWSFARAISSGDWKIVGWDQGWRS